MKKPLSGVPLPIGRSLYSKAILMDVGAFLALVNHRDQYHPAAIECLDSIKDFRLPVFVSIPTIYECHRRFLFDLGQIYAISFLRNIFDGSVNILRTGEEDEREAQRLIESIKPSD